MTREWDAVAYERLSAPQTQWGRVVVDRLELSGDERVVDAGCGTGRVTAMLLERLPDGRVIGIDGSAAMIGRRPTGSRASAGSSSSWPISPSPSPSTDR